MNPLKNSIKKKKDVTVLKEEENEKKTKKNVSNKLKSKIKMRSLFIERSVAVECF